MPQRACDHCGKVYEAKRRTSRFDSPACRVAHSRRPDLSTINTQAVVAEPVEFASGLFEAVRRDLLAVDRLDTIQGQAALELARALTAPGESGSGRASLHRQLTAAVAEAMVGVKVVDDPLDELKAARDRKSGVA